MRYYALYKQIWKENRTWKHGNVRFLTKSAIPEEFQPMLEINWGFLGTQNTGITMTSSLRITS